MNKISHYLKWNSFRDLVEEKRLRIFSLSDLIRIFPANKEVLKHFLSRHAKEGHLVRLKRGLYTLKNFTPDEMTLANRLYIPSYLSLEYALSYYSIIPESVYSVTSVTTKPTRTFVCLGKTFTYQKIKHKAFFEYTAKERNEGSVFIASPEKAMADYLYFVSLGTRNRNDRTNWKVVDIEKIKNILKEKF